MNIWDLRSTMEKPTKVLKPFTHRMTKRGVVIFAYMYIFGSLNLFFFSGIMNFGGAVERAVVFNILY